MDAVLLLPLLLMTARLVLAPLELVDEVKTPEAVLESMLDGPLLVGIEVDVGEGRVTATELETLGLVVCNDKNVDKGLELVATGLLVCCTIVLDCVLGRLLPAEDPVETTRDVRLVELLKDGL